MGNGLTHRRSYHDRGRLTADLVERAGGTPVLGQELATAKTWSGASARISSVFGADAFGRTSASALGLASLPISTLSAVKEADRAQWLAQGSDRASFSYDAADNATAIARQGTTVTPAFGVDHRPAAWNGTIASDEDGWPLLLPDGTRFEHDGLGRIYAAELPGGQRWHFMYDPFGFLVGWETAGSSTKLQYANGKIFRQRTDAETRTHVPGEGLTPLALQHGGREYFFHPSFGERIGFATDATGAVAEQYEYDAYATPAIKSPSGAILASSAIGQDLLLSGQPWIAALALHRQGLRWYRPSWGRFLTPDPLGFADGPNPFLYAGAQPIMFIDPLGLKKHTTAGALDLCLQTGMQASICWKMSYGDPRFGVGDARLGSGRTLTESLNDIPAGAAASTGASAVAGASGLGAAAAWTAFAEAAPAAAAFIAKTFGTAGFAAGFGTMKSSDDANIVGPLLSAAGPMIANAANANNVAVNAALAEAGGGGRLVDLYRAVKPAELADIRAIGGFRTLAGGVEGKYFTTSGEAAASYARQAVRAFNDPPYTIIRTEVPQSLLLQPGISATVDRGIPAYVLPEDVLTGLRPEILNYSPVPR